MPSFSSSPVTPSSHPRRRRQPSNLDLSSTSPSTYSTNGFSMSPSRSPQTPRSSLQYSPITPRQRPPRGMTDSISMSSDLAYAADGGGHGSLADELADAWDEEEDTSGIHQMGRGGSVESQPPHAQEEEQMVIDSTHDLGFGAPLTLSKTQEPPAIPSPTAERSSLHPTKPNKRGESRDNRKPSHHHRRHESQYDGSDYGEDLDLEDMGGIAPSLSARIANIEALARSGTEDNGSATDGVIKRVVVSLRDLGGQSGIENGATRLITAHTSLTSHLTSQTRHLHTLTHPLLFSPSPFQPISEDLSEIFTSLLPLLEHLLPLLPYPPTPTPLDPLHALSASTTDLTHTLRSLSDTLHESRQTTSTASRRLRSARDLVTELSREHEEREEGVRWIERGNWDERLAGREAGQVCGEVVSGFEAVCGEWRQRLFGHEGMDVVGGVAA